MIMTTLSEALGIGVDKYLHLVFGGTHKGNKVFSTYKEALEASYESSLSCIICLTPLTLSGVLVGLSSYWKYRTLGKNTVYYKNNAIYLNKSLDASLGININDSRIYRYGATYYDTQVVANSSNFSTDSDKKICDWCLLARDGKDATLEDQGDKTVEALCFYLGNEILLGLEV